MAMSDYEIAARGSYNGLPYLVVARQTEMGIVAHKLVRFGHHNPKYVWREIGFFYSRLNRAIDPPRRFNLFKRPRYLSDSAIDNRLRTTCEESAS